MHSKCTPTHSMSDILARTANALFNRKGSQVKIGMILKFYGWPWKTIGHLSYASSSFVHHFAPIGEFKLEVQSRNTQFWSKSMIFLAMWPWKLRDDLEKQ